MTDTAKAKAPLVAALTGAGVSTDSGLRDYRGPQGLWRDDPGNERLVTIDSYLADADVRARSWQMRLDTGLLDVRPNAAHHAFADYERTGLPIRVLTQNVDGLHQLGGVSARKVLELHGTARRTECVRCHTRGDVAGALARVRAGEADPPCEKCGGVLKTATVFFGEHLDPAVLGDARAIAAACDVLIAAGTTLQVHPAAGLVDIALMGGARLIVVNADPTPYDDVAAEVIREPIGASVPALLRRLAAEAGATWPAEVAR